MSLVFSSQIALRCRYCGNLLARQHGDVIVGRGVGEEGLQAVIIGLQNRIELVIVAARAAVGQAQKDAPGRIGDVVENLLPALLQIARVALVRIVAVEAGRDRASGLSGHISSPAICSCTKRSYGLSWLNDSIT